MAKKSLKINAVLSGIKQCCAIIFPLITFPYVSRILGSDGFGKYSFSYSVVSYFLLIAALGINTYAIREGAKIREDKKKINEFASQVFSINLCSVLLSYILLGITIAFSTKIQAYVPYILIQSVVMILVAIGTDWINSIYEDFFYITVRYILMQIVAIFMMFTFVRTSSDVIAYCIISVLAASGGNLLNIFYVRKYVKFNFTFHMNVKTHIIPLMILFINSVAITIYVNSDITMLGFYYDDSVVGVYSFASKIYSIIKQLVNAIVVVSLPRIAYIVKNQSNQYKSYMDKIFWALSVALLPIVAGTLGMSNTIIQIAGGEEYVSGNYALDILSIALIFAILASFFTNCVLIIYSQEKKCLQSTIVSAFINVGLNFALLPKIGITGAAITTVIAEATNCFVQMRFAKKYFDWTKLKIKPMFPYFFGSGLILFVCICCNIYIENIYFRMITALVASSFIYGIVLILNGKAFIVDIIIQVMNRVKR